MAADCDLLVVGAGAAGLLAARCAAERGRRVILVEKNRRPGAKILVSGGGRCNLTTTVTGPALEAAYGAAAGRWLRHALRAYPPAALRAELEAAGVPLKAEALEKVFPVSDRAADVLAALLRRAEAAGVALHCGRPVTALRREREGFLAETPAGPLTASRAILASGGRSYPQMGTTGDGYRFAAALGHTVTPTLPALAPLCIEAPWVRALAGLSVEDCGLALADAAGRVLVRRHRPLLFTHQGLSGPGPMDVSGWVEAAGAGCTLALDFAPPLGREALDAAIRAGIAESGRRAAWTLLPESLPERLRRALAEQAGATGPAAALDRAGRARLVVAVKALRLPVAGTLGFAKAEVTRGGIPLDEVDPRSMASRRVPGLFICGELLDVDGPIGGYNFQAAFATGRLAGLQA
ncbi:aminoacetone oxidase family FAD-binding enzyme [bacterium]|nr:aminoacetone oxidase family FAD-binding enzyme [bacterium]